MKYEHCGCTGNLFSNCSVSHSFLYTNCTALYTSHSFFRKWSLSSFVQTGLSCPGSQITKRLTAWQSGSCCAQLAPSCHHTPSLDRSFCPAHLLDLYSGTWGLGTSCATLTAVRVLKQTELVR